ncbi:uncharacterized protein LOC101846861 [Aplysia californica]|uniref:Uncharacterized protein LOC101846861 n=1 Tax=Aplysia californica TaxID=6500 RepID=A0ABM1W4X5_APLCA|nr:uncharacterized protein LOC101846861 [Aplysia californica]
MTSEGTTVKDGGSGPGPSSNGERRPPGDGGDARKRNHGNDQQQQQQVAKGKRTRHESEISKVSVESMEQYIPTPPDGGWGWVIVFSSMICNLIVDGIGYTFGVFLLEFVEAFQAPKSKISLVGSLLCGVYLFAGPIVSAMTNKFGCRPVVIFGSCLSTAAFVLSTFSPNVDMLIVTYGVFGGFGLGMIYLPSIVSVGYYFEKKRAFATGLAVCGSGIGTFMFPPLSEFLLDEYAWQGGLLIIAGIIFQGCICGALMRPLEAKPVCKSKKAKSLGAVDRDRGMSESSTFTNSVGDPNKIMEGVMEAKLLREKGLQDNDSDLGSLPSIAFIKRGDSISVADHRRLSSGIPIPGSDAARKYKLSVGSSYADSAGSPVREISGLTNSPPVESPGSGTPKIVLDKGKAESQMTSSDADSEVKVIEAADADNLTDGTSTERSDYFTAPESDPNSPTKSAAGRSLSTPSDESESTKATVGTGETVLENGDLSTGTPTITENVIIPNNVESSNKTEQSQPQSKSHNTSEFAPLLEVPSPVIRNGSVSQTGGYGGSRTNMSHLHSLRSLHVSKKDLARPLYRKDIFYSGSVLNIPQFHSQPDMKSYITSITTIPGEMEFVDGPSSSSKCVNKCCACLPRSARDVLSEMVDISLLKDPSFMLICLGNFTAFLGFFIPFVFLVDRAVSLGINKSQAAFLISIIGITNTVGRVAVGKLADLRVIDSLVITYMSIIVIGLVTALVPFCDTYALLATASAVFGLGVAAFISLSSIIICDRMGLEKLTNAFGLMSMVRGISGMIGPPFAGFLFDSSGTYDLSFYLGGLLLFIGAACHVFLHLPCFRKNTPPQEMIMEEAIGEITLENMGSKPEIVTVEEALSSV